MRLFRLVRAPWVNDLSGTGAALHGGRWNPPGVRVLYTSASPSLAVLELVVHLAPGLAPTDLWLVELQTPEPLDVTEVGELPPDWRTYPAPGALADRGRAWVASGHSLALRVPSVLSPGESNYLLNPAHPDFCGVTVARREPFRFDPRLAT